MLNRFMITAATAALIAGTSFAYAQQGPSKEGPSGGAGTQQSAPSSGGAEHGMKSSQGGEKMQPQGAQNQRAQDMKSGAKEERSEKSAQETKGSKSTQAEERSKSTQNEKGAAGKDMKAEGREGKDMKAEGREGMKAEDRQGREGKNAAEGGRMENRTTTTGQAGAGARLTTEQRTRISTVIRDQHVAPVSNVSFAVSVGTRVPREIGFHPLPQEIVTIYPEWRGYEFFLVRDEIVVVDPRTLEIVAVLPA
jgi:hypothetical protein